MLRCRKCNLDIDGNKERCPLCQSKLTGEPSFEMFPPVIEKGIAAEFIIKIVSFAAIASTVICAVTDYLISGRLSWSVISVFGIICAWLTTCVGIYYRKKILKNITWEMFLITAMSVIWDRFTGWLGWSLDFVLPCSCICAVTSIFIIAKVLRMNAREYILYLIIGGLYGMIPLICVLAGLVRINYPSVICSGASAIFMAALFIFRGRTTKDEFERRFHI